MSTPDPKTVREIAREHILDAGRNADDISAYVAVRVGPDLTKHQHAAWCSAIREAIRTATVTVSWPGEQPQDERDDETSSSASRVRATLDRHAARGSIGGEYLDDDVRAVLDNREAWRNLALSRGREQDSDVRAVRALTNATGRMLTRWAEANDAVRRELWTEVHDRADDVDDRFRDRFAELDAKAAGQ